MGFNISGIVINKNYENSFDELEKELGWKLKKQGEIDFETASSNWKEEDICDVYFSEKGTLVFLGIEKTAASLALKNANTLAFILSETSMTFYLNYCENGVKKRSIIETEDERQEDNGEKLEIEKTAEDTSEIIWGQIGTVLGKSYWDIELEEKAMRYVFS